MLLVFALTAALCLQIYVFSAQISRRSEAQAHAVIAVQNTAESVKFCRGDVSRYPRVMGGAGTAQQWEIRYDENWEETSHNQAAYRVLVTPEASPLSALGRASVKAVTESGDVLFSISVSWQEVSHE